MAQIKQSSIIRVFRLLLKSLLVEKMNYITISIVLGSNAGDEPGVLTSVGGSDVTVRVHDRAKTYVRGTRPDLMLKFEQ